MPSLPWPERVVLLAALAASAALFWLRFRRVLEILRGARPTPGFRLAPLGARWRRFLFEVLMQRKVVSGRPWPGLAHALVFWGFCAFALVSANHLAAALGFELFSPRGVFGRAYLGLAAVFAALVAVSIVGLAVRRYIVRPRWLGRITAESGVIAGLIFLLMATYLAGFGLGEDTAAGRANWWLHTLALAAFLPLVPHTKHLHLLLGPVAVFLRRAGFSSIPPLEGDEDFGLHAGRDVTRIDALQALACVECGRCTQQCPAFLTEKALNPKEVVLGLRAYLREAGPRGEEPLLGRHVSAEAVFQCTTCGACECECPVGIQHLPLMVGLRRGAVNTGAWDDEHGARLFLNLERHGNPLGFPAGERQQFIERHALPWFDGTQEYCLWLGCMGSYDPEGRETVLALARLLRHAGVSFGVLRRERCTGDAARRLGNDAAFMALAETNLETLRQAGVKKMVSICPHCVRTLGEDYGEFGKTFAIEHHSELLARLAPRLPAPSAARVAAVFHDPCYLGRYREVYEAPRAVLARYAAPLEAPRSRARSFCCGAGGGRMFLGEERGRRIHAERAAELAGTGAGQIVTACPFCRSMFRDALSGPSPAPPALLDIAQVAAAALVNSQPERPS